MSGFTQLGKILKQDVFHPPCADLPRHIIRISILLEHEKALAELKSKLKTKET
jgi:hypothetical protein